MNMAKSNETKMNGIETLVHHSNPSNKQMNVDPKFKKLFDDIKKPKLASKQYSMVMTMLNGQPISTNDIVKISLTIAILCSLSYIYVRTRND